MGNALALPVLFGLDAEAAPAAAAGPLKPGPEIYQSIGVEPVINCRGTFTIIGGSVELPEVRAAMDAAARHFVQIDELADAVGRRFAELTGAEWGMVSAGCAAGMKHVTAACVTGGNPEKLIRIPDLTDLDKTEVVIPRSSRNVYDHAIRNIGVKMITVETLRGTRERAQSANGDDLPDSRTTARVRDRWRSRRWPGSPSPKNIPILVDAAAEMLTIPNVHLQRGATIVAYSGGKAICGPQCAGLLLGRKDILQSAWQASAPHHGPGRDNKVGREETLGMLAAVEAWVKRDHAGEWKTWLSWLDTISKRVGGDRWRQDRRCASQRVCRTRARRCRSRGTRRSFTSPARSWPRSWRGRSRGSRWAWGGGGGRGGGALPPPRTTGVTVTAWQMQPGEDKIVADRSARALSRTKRSAEIDHRCPLRRRISAAAGTSTSSSSAAAASTRCTSSRMATGFRARTREISPCATMVGMIEGDKVTLRSIDRRPGDSVTFIFSGTLAADGTHLGPDPSRRVPDRQVHREASRLLDDAHANHGARRAADRDVALWKGEEEIRRKLLFSSSPHLL